MEGARVVEKSLYVAIWAIPDASGCCKHPGRQDQSIQVLEGCKFAHMTVGVRYVLPGMMYVAKVQGGGTPNGFVIHPLISFITPLHIPHHEPGSGERERVTDREGMMKKIMIETCSRVVTRPLFKSSGLRLWRMTPLMHRYRL